MIRAIFTISIVSITLSLFYLGFAWHYPIGSAKQPGPGLYPLVVGIFLLVTSIGTGFGVRSKAAQGKIDWPRGAGRWRMAAILGAILTYIILLPYAGHAIAATIVILVALQAIGGQRWPMKIVLSVAIGFGSYYLFNTLLGTPLPRGIWLE